MPGARRPAPVSGWKRSSGLGDEGERVGAPEQVRVAERRAERLATPTPEDNRITHGCINVSPAFYEQVVRPTFERGGVFYILPDKASISEVFPGFAQSRGKAGEGR